MESSFIRGQISWPHFFTLSAKHQCVHCCDAYWIHVSFVQPFFKIKPKPGRQNSNSFFSKFVLTKEVTDRSRTRTRFLALCLKRNLSLLSAPTPSHFIGHVPRSSYSKWLGLEAYWGPQLRDRCHYIGRCYGEVVGDEVVGDGGVGDEEVGAAVLLWAMKKEILSLFPINSSGVWWGIPARQSEFWLSNMKKLQPLPDLDVRNPRQLQEGACWAPTVTI